MNERILELAEQAYPHDNNINIWRHHERLEKFAELIVRECAELCLADYDADIILAHFGVEE
jgi:hypothetical protein